MPNISFDVFFDQDFINVSASRGKHAPKAKPEWKVRTAPKLPPKEIAEDPAATPRPVQRPPINSTRPPLSKLESKSGESTSSVDQPKRKPPKLGPSKNVKVPAKDTPASEQAKKTS